MDKQFYRNLEAIKYKPRYVYAREVNNPIPFRFRFHELDKTGQLKMARSLRQKGLTVKLWGGDLRKEWLENPTGMIRTEPVYTTPNRWFCLLQAIWEVTAYILISYLNCWKKN